MLQFYRSFAFITLLTFTSGVFAQWQNVAPNLLGGFFGRGDAEAAMTFADGKIWVGRTALWVSPDTGTTWTQSYQGFQGQILDICAYDKTTCIFSTNGGEVYITKDGGATWKLLTTIGGDIHAISFFDDPRHIIAFVGGYRYLTHDGGTTWAQKLTNSEVLDCNWISGGILYFSTGNVSTKRGAISISTDYGETWSQTAGTYDYDSYSFEESACKPGYLFVINEDYLSPYDQISCIFRSTDRGATWQPVASRDRTLDFFCGSISATKSALYAQTHLSGIMRSTDDGLTWNSIGGPNGDFDTRLVTTINSNIILAVDQADGSIYRTFNSGGDSLNDDGIEPTPLSFSASSLFEGDTANYCDSSIVRSIIVRHRECSPPEVSSQNISGASDYTLLSGLPSSLSGADTILIRFDPTTRGSRTGVYKVELADGRVYGIDLLGTGSGLDTILVSPRSLNFDSLYTCDDPTLQTIYLSYLGCNFRDKLSERIDGDQDFTIVAQAPDSLGSNDFIRISFSPADTGDRKATYVLAFANGDSIIIPLTGFGKESSVVSIATADQTLDTLGVSVRVPFAINGLDRASSVEFTAHYGPKLEYLGSRSISGSSLDIPGQTFPGRAKIRIPATLLVLNGISGYAEFNVIADSQFTPTVWFDSLNVTSTFTPCSYDSSAVSLIRLPPDCGFPIIANFYYHKLMPELAIIPNPSAGEVTLVSNLSLGDVELQVFDQIGKLVLKQNANVSAGFPIQLTLPQASTGYHRVALLSTYGSWSVPVMVQK